MTGIRRMAVTGAVAWLLAAFALLVHEPDSVAQEAEATAPLLEGMGDHSFEISTNNEQAQRYFDQGLILHYGFNHTEAIRSFQQAQKLDPSSAMAFWGEALARGPHLNAVMAESNVAPARAAMNKARELAGAASQRAEAGAENGRKGTQTGGNGAQNGKNGSGSTGGVTQRERDYIEALAARYSGGGGSQDQAYADAMRRVAQRYPDDPDAQALFAEALMLLSRHKYWQADGEPNAVGKEIVTTLEESMKRQPNHPGTNHFYIHTVEMGDPKRGEAAADRMRDLVPGVGHLQHMPSHIYLQIGRYADASLANEKAVEADRRYHEQHGARGMYRISYMPHNAMYLTFSASMEGRSEKTLEAAQTARDLIPEGQPQQAGYGSLTQGYALRYYAMARFGKWEELSKEPKPEEGLLYPKAIWHFARGVAFVRTGSPDSARAQWEQVTKLATAETAERMDVFSPGTALAVVQIAGKTLAGEMAAASGDFEAAIKALREAVEIEDKLGYHEPPAWFVPSRQTLGAILLEAGRANEAEEVYRKDLEDLPKNGWSLYGLGEALEEQGKTEEAERVRGEFREAWANADVELRGSRM